MFVCSDDGTGCIGNPLTFKDLTCKDELAHEKDKEFTVRVGVAVRRGPQVIAVSAEAPGGPIGLGQELPCGLAVLGTGMLFLAGAMASSRRWLDGARYRPVVVRDVARRAPATAPPSVREEGAMEGWVMASPGRLRGDLGPGPLRLWNRLAG